MQRQTRPPIGFHFLIESTVRFSFLVLLLVYGIMSNNTLFCAPEGPYLSFAGAKVRQLFELTKYYKDFFQNIFYLLIKYIKGTRARKFVTFSDLCYLCIRFIRKRQKTHGTSILQFGDSPNQFHS